MEAAIRCALSEPDSSFRYVVTPNVSDLVTVLENPAEIGLIYANAWRRYCDSRVLRSVARLYGRRLSLITGSDLTASLLAEANRRGLRVVVIGPTQEDGTKLSRLFPQAQIVTHTPPMGFIKSEAEIKECVDVVIRERAPLNFLAVGMPRQEMLAHRLASSTEAIGVGLCVGAAIDFITGKQQRAPVWMQRAGIEWLYRLLSQPRRLASRYLIQCPKVFYYLVRQPLTRGPRTTQQ